MITQCLCIELDYLIKNDNYEKTNLPDILIIPIEERFLDFIKKLYSASKEIELMKSENNLPLFSLDYVYSGIIFSMKREDAIKLFNINANDPLITIDEDEEIYSQINSLKEPCYDIQSLERYILDNISSEDKLKKDDFIFYPIDQIHLKTIDCSLEDDMTMWFAMESKSENGIYFQSKEFSYNKFFNEF